MAEIGIVIHRQDGDGLDAHVVVRPGSDRSPCLCLAWKKEIVKSVMGSIYLQGCSHPCRLHELLGGVVDLTPLTAFRTMNIE